MHLAAIPKGPAYWKNGPRCKAESQSQQYHRHYVSPQTPGDPHGALVKPGTGMPDLPHEVEPSQLMSQDRTSSRPAFTPQSGHYWSWIGHLYYRLAAFVLNRPYGKL